MWDRPVHKPLPCPVYQLPPCCESSPPGCLSPPLLLVWVNVSSLTPWLLDFHTGRFSVSSGCFLFLNLLSFFWLCEEAQCVYVHLLVWKSENTVLYDFFLKVKRRIQCLYNVQPFQKTAQGSSICLSCLGTDTDSAHFRCLMAAENKREWGALLL